LTFIEAYIGGAGASFPMLHYDGVHTHAFLMQIEGVKEYIALPPNQEPFVYPRAGRWRNQSCVDVGNPDFERHPLFAYATGSRFELHPGETLFVPAGWWHTARILTPSITVSTNCVNAANWSSFVDDYCRQSLPVPGYQRSSGLKRFVLRSYLQAFMHLQLLL
jgi:hypothetical protein